MVCPVDPAERRGLIVVGKLGCEKRKRCSSFFGFSYLNHGGDEPGCWRTRGELLQTDVCPSERFGFRWLCALASLGTELLRSLVPKIVQNIYGAFPLNFSSPVFLRTAEGLGKVAPGQFAKEVVGVKRLVCVWILRRELLLELKLAGLQA